MIRTCARFAALPFASLALALPAVLALPDAAEAQDPRMNMFLTSTNPGDGANLGGLAGADAHCAHLAYAAGMGSKTWRAYLSAGPTEGRPEVNARDRIGFGPFYNYNGVIVAENLDELHGQNNLHKETALTEVGAIVRGRGDTPNRHDVLTGSTVEGSWMPSQTDSTCGNWTSNGAGSAQVGHFDRTGGGQDPTSWNSAHATQGCSQQNLRATGGDGLFFCFAVN